MLCTHHNHTSSISHTSIAVTLAPSHSSAYTHAIQTTVPASQSRQLPHPHRVPRQPHRQTKDDHMTTDTTQGHRPSSKSEKNLIILKKNSKGMGIILKARKFLKKKVLLQLYYSFVTPYLIYCLEIWGNASDIHLQPLIKTNTRLLELLLFLSYCSHTNILFKRLNALPFKNYFFLR